MQRDILSVDNHCERHLVKQVHERLVDLLVQLIDALLAEIILSGDFPAFVIASQEYDRVRLEAFQGAEVSHDLWAIHASVHIVAQKDIFQLVNRCS